MSPPPEFTTTGGVFDGLAALCASLPPLAEPSTTCPPLSLEELWTVAFAAQKGRRWVNPQHAAARILPRTTRPTRSARLVVVGRARRGRRVAAGSRAGPDDDDGDSEPALAGNAGRA